MRSSLSLALVGLSLALSVPAQAAKPYAASGSFLMSANCAGCPKGEKGIELHPAVMEYILADEGSVVRAHYATLRQWDMGAKNKTSSNPLIMSGIQEDLANIYQANKASIDSLTGGTDLTSALHGDEQGTAFARGVARYAAEGANEMLMKKGWIQWMWGWRWEVAPGTDPAEFKTPTVFGTNLTLIAPHKSDNTITMHIWGKGMIPLVKRPVCTYDLSQVEGAWDPSADLTYEQVAASIKRTEGEIEVDFDPTYGFITGAHKR